MKKIRRKIRMLDLFAFLVIATIAMVIFLSFKRKNQTVFVELESGQVINDNGGNEFYWIANNIQSGDNVYDEFGRQIATVVDVLRTQMYKLGNQNLQIGDSLSLTIKNFKFKGNIINIAEKKGDLLQQGERKRMTLKLLSQNVHTWLIDTYTPDFIVYNQAQHDIFRFIKVLNITNSANVFDVVGGRLVQTNSSDTKDVEFLASVEVNCQNGICYYNRFLPIKIGLNIWTQSNRSIISNALIEAIVDEKTE